MTRPSHRHTVGATRLGGLAIAAVALSFMVGCSGDDTADVPDDDGAATPTVTVPPSRLSPFCQAMIGLGEELESDPPPSDPEALIIETYLSIVDDVPEQIKPDFLVVLADLQGTELPPTTLGNDTTSTTTTVADEVDTVETTDAAAFDEEGWLPADESELRLNGYVQFACRDAVNNPGPPATPPLDDIEFDEP